MRDGIRLEIFYNNSTIIWDEDPSMDSAPAPTARNISTILIKLRNYPIDLAATIENATKLFQ